MNSNARLLGIKEAPLTWKEMDILTAGERYMQGTIDFPLVEYVSSCFPQISKINEDKIAQIWNCLTASYHLHKTLDADIVDVTNAIQFKTARIYEQEAQRILGSLFDLDAKFWISFYSRQESECNKPLVALDALYYMTDCTEQITYQLLLQCLKALLKGHYQSDLLKNKSYQNSKRLIIDLDVSQLNDWINNQIHNYK